MTDPARPLYEELVEMNEKVKPALHDAALPLTPLMKEIEKNEYAYLKWKTRAIALNSDMAERNLANFNANPRKRKKKK